MTPNTLTAKQNKTALQLQKKFIDLCVSSRNKIKAIAHGMTETKELSQNFARLTVAEHVAKHYRRDAQWWLNHAETIKNLNNSARFWDVIQELFLTK